MSDDKIINLTDELRRTWRQSTCRHIRFEIDEREGDVYCRDCGQLVSAFHALLALARRWQDLENHQQAMRKEQEELRAYKPHLRAVKKLESIWRGTMLPCCPNCHAAIEAEKLASGALVTNPAKRKPLRAVTPPAPQSPN